MCGSEALLQPHGAVQLSISTILSYVVLMAVFIQKDRQHEIVM